jgi:hypothetical protein
MIERAATCLARLAVPASVTMKPARLDRLYMLPLRDRVSHPAARRYIA